MGHRIRTALVFLLAIALLGWFLRGVNLAEVGQQIRRARIDLLALSFVFLTVPYLARTIRWRYLLEPIGHARFRTAFRSTIIGFAAIGLLPAHIREQYGFAWGRRQARASARASAILRTTRRLLPPAIALWPEARRGA